MEGLVMDTAFWASRRVLITGHTGFKGTWLSLWLLRAGAEVIGYSRGLPTTPSLFEAARVAEEVDSLDGDVRDLDALKRVLAERRPQIVIHMAAQPLVRRSFRDPVETYETNVMGAVNLLEAVRLSEDVRAVVNVTSDKCYENREREQGYREQEPMGGKDPYSSSKGCSELVTAAYRASFFGDEGPNVATARAGNVIGGGDWAVDRLIPDLVRGALSGTATVIRNPDAIRPWQHLLNPLEGYLELTQRLWDSAEFAEAWNFGPDLQDARPVRLVADRMTELWGEGLRWEEDRGSSPGPPEATYLRLDSSRAHHRLGWRPRWDLDRALGSVVEWYRGAHEGDDVRELTLKQIGDFEEARNKIPARP